MFLPWSLDAYASIIWSWHKIDILYTRSYRWFFMRPPFWGLADGPMVSHWLGGRLWGLAIGFPHWSFAQESLQSYLDCLLFRPNHTTPVLCKLFIYFKLSSHCEDSEPNGITWRRSCETFCEPWTGDDSSLILVVTIILSTCPHAVLMPHNDEVFISIILLFCPPTHSIFLMPLL
jgi:hypothetical protein